jgi:hypothetical protein
LWIATTDGFFSIVCGYRMIDGVPTMDSSVLMVRARRKDHLENLRLRFPALGEVKTELGTDYPHRIITDRKTAIAIVSSAASSIDYCNFKNAAATKDDIAYDEFLHHVWLVGCQMEDVPKPVNRFPAATKKRAKRKGKGKR